MGERRRGGEWAFEGLCLLVRGSKEMGKRAGGNEIRRKYKRSNFGVKETGKGFCSF